MSKEEQPGSWIFSKPVEGADQTPEDLAMMAERVEEYLEIMFARNPSACLYLILYSGAGPDVFRKWKELYSKSQSQPSKSDESPNGIRKILGSELTDDELRRGMTLEDIADLTGISSKTIGRVMKHYNKDSFEVKTKIGQVRRAE